MNLRDLQLWLNAHGASLVVDGLPGPATRSAILNLFINRSAPAVTSQDIAQIAARLGGTPRQVAAVAKVESAGGGWDDAGRLKCLYERHYFWKRLRILIPVLSNPTPGGYTIDADRDGIKDSWEKVADAAMRSPIAAFESASWGKFQIMGAHASADPKRRDQVVYQGNAVEFVWWLTRSERNHYEALARFIEVNGLRGAFQRLSTNPDDCRAFARGYNGGGYEKGYHRKLAEAMA
ncbi:N-acetylmuramidase domain-containing protein [Sphingopyxis macrogoltabida]|uniref:N-acetylmuramidase domain-containing protein n=1 Tax=Sphingopyxis macrogoltabida TaxID=33050 RepID=UPI0006CA811A|nr:N-acetylmuramidase domain-containing protein [Sphingopyxis macrogoltabida]